MSPLKVQAWAGLVAWNFAQLLGADGATTVISDGTSRRPFCSWSSQCTWDNNSQSICAQKLCQSSGYIGGTFVSASNNMCTKSYVSGSWYYYLVDRAQYFTGSAINEAQITASCENASSSSSSTTSTTPSSPTSSTRTTTRTTTFGSILVTTTTVTTSSTTSSSNTLTTTSTQTTTTATTSKTTTAPSGVQISISITTFALGGGAADSSAFQIELRGRVSSSGWIALPPSLHGAVGTSAATVSYMDVGEIRQVALQAGGPAADSWSVAAVTVGGVSFGLPSAVVTLQSPCQPADQSSWSGTVLTWSCVDSVTLSQTCFSTTTDVLGTALQTSASVSPTECQLRCQGLLGCNAFSFYDNRTCVLRSTVTSHVSSTGVTSGPRECEVEGNSWLPTSQDGSVQTCDGGATSWGVQGILSNTATLEQCEYACTRRARCNYVQFEASTSVTNASRCHLYEDCSALRACPGDTCGRTMARSQSFIWVDGACRTASRSTGVYSRTMADPWECRASCAGNLSCVAYETSSDPLGNCELHFESITGAELLAGYACWIKMPQKSCMATLLENPDFTGSQTSFFLGAYNRSAMSLAGLTNAQVGAIRVIGNCTLTLYDLDDYEGASAVFSRGSYNASAMIDRGMPGMSVGSLVLQPEVGTMPTGNTEASAYESKVGRDACEAADLLESSNWWWDESSAQRRCDELRCAMYTWSNDASEQQGGAWFCQRDTYSSVNNAASYPFWRVGRPLQVSTSTSASTTTATPMRTETSTTATTSTTQVTTSTMTSTVTSRTATLTGTSTTLIVTATTTLTGSSTTRTLTVTSTTTTLTVTSTTTTLTMTSTTTTSTTASSTTTSTTSSVTSTSITTTTSSSVTTTTSSSTSATLTTSTSTSATLTTSTTTRTVSTTTSTTFSSTTTSTTIPYVQVRGTISMMTTPDPTQFCADGAVAAAVAAAVASVANVPTGQVNMTSCGPTPWRRLDDGSRGPRRLSASGTVGYTVRVQAGPPSDAALTSLADVTISAMGSLINSNLRALGSSSTVSIWDMSAPAKFLDESCIDVRGLYLLSSTIFVLTQSGCTVTYYSTPDQGVFSGTMEGSQLTLIGPDGVTKRTGYLYGNGNMEFQLNGNEEGFAYKQILPSGEASLVVTRGALTDCSALPLGPLAAPMFQSSVSAMSLSFPGLADGGSGTGSAWLFQFAATLRVDTEGTYQIGLQVGQPLAGALLVDSQPAFTFGCGAGGASSGAVFLPAGLHDLSFAVARGEWPSSLALVYQGPDTQNVLVPIPSSRLLVARTTTMTTSTSTMTTSSETQTETSTSSSTTSQTTSSSSSTSLSTTTVSTSSSSTTTSATTTRTTTTSVTTSTLTTTTTTSVTSTTLTATTTTLTTTVLATTAPDVPAATTTTATTTTTAGICDSTPTVVNGDDHSNCTNMRNGGTCWMRCRQGYRKGDDRSNIICQQGTWVVPTTCVVVGSATKIVQAVQIAFQMASLLGGGSGDGGAPKVTLEWAQDNRRNIILAVSLTLGCDESKLTVEFVKVIVKIRKLAEEEALPGFAGNVNLLLLEGAPPPLDHPRRLQGAAGTSADASAGEAESLEVRVTVQVTPQGNQSLQSVASGLLAALVGDSNASASAPAGGGSTGTGGGFLATLATQLQEQGQPMPSGLSVVASDTPPVVLPNFVVAIAEWMQGDWDPCSSVCGEGEATRSVQCSTGEDANCAAELGLQPAVKKVCVDYTGCKFQASCPFGHGSSLDCGAQRGIAAGILAFAGLLCCGFCARRLQLACRPKQQGSVSLGRGSATFRTSWRIYRPGSDLELGGGAAKDGKTHIVWDVDAPGVQKWFAEQGSTLKLGASTDKLGGSSHDMLRSPSLPRISSNARLSDDEDDEHLELQIKSLAKFCRTGLAVEATGTGPWRRGLRSSRSLRAEDILMSSSPAPSPTSGPSVPTAYEDGEVVEYYSKTLGKWLVGAVRVTTKKGEGRSSSSCSLSAGRSQVLCRYSVDLASGQTRVGVGLDVLRRPLKTGEPVEVFSRRSGGWLPGVVGGPLAASPTTCGYRVQLDGAPTPLEGVSAEKLRRRFAAGDRVQVYRGPALGWRPAQVKEVLAPGQEDEVMLELPAYVHGGDELDDMESPASRGPFASRRHGGGRGRSGSYSASASSLEPDADEELERSADRRGTTASRSTVGSERTAEPWQWARLLPEPAAAGSAANAEEELPEWLPSCLFR